MGTGYVPPSLLILATVHSKDLGPGPTKILNLKTYLKCNKESMVANMISELMYISLFFTALFSRYFVIPKLILCTAKTMVANVIGVRFI